MLRFASRPLAAATGLLAAAWAFVAFPLVLGPVLAHADPPPDYVPPQPISGTSLFQIHRYDLEGLVADRQALAVCKVNGANCKADLDEAIRLRVEDSTNPNATIWPLWVRALIYTAGTIAIGVAGKLVGDRV